VIIPWPHSENKIVEFIFARCELLEFLAAEVFDNFTENATTMLVSSESAAVSANSQRCLYKTSTIYAELGFSS